jgi:hypothetical protein
MPTPLPNQQFLAQRTGRLADGHDVYAAICPDLQTGTLHLGHFTGWPADRPVYAIAEALCTIESGDLVSAIFTGILADGREVFLAYRCPCDIPPSGSTSESGSDASGSDSGSESGSDSGSESASDSASDSASESASDFASDSGSDSTSESGSDSQSESGSSESASGSSESASDSASASDSGSEESGSGPVGCCRPCPPGTLHVTILSATGNCADCLAGVEFDIEGGCNEVGGEPQDIWANDDVECEGTNITSVLNCGPPTHRYAFGMHCNAGLTFGGGEVTVLSCKPFHATFTFEMTSEIETPPCCVGTISGEITE